MVYEGVVVDKVVVVVWEEGEERRQEVELQ